MSVEIEPAEALEFNRPFTQQVARYLKVKNLHDTPVAYKVKTTAPRSYCVRPNSGRIEAGQEVEVQVLLQAMKVDVPLDMKCKDKFLLQTTQILDLSNDASLSDLWAQIEKDVLDGKMSKDSIQQKKIRCVWGPPLDSNESQDTKSPQPEVKPEPLTKQNGVPTFIQEPPIVQPPIPSTLGGQPPTFSTPSVIPPLVPTTPNDNTSSRSLLETQLIEAKAQIAALTKQLEVTGGSGLKQRNMAQVTSNSTSSSQRPASRPASSARELLVNSTEQGVPVKIVAYLCLAAFLLAYLFF